MQHQNCCKGILKDFKQSQKIFAHIFLLLLVPLRLLFLFSQFHGFVSVSESYSFLLRFESSFILFLCEKRLKIKQYARNALLSCHRQTTLLDPAYISFSALKVSLLSIYFLPPCARSKLSQSRSVSPTSLIFWKKWEWIYWKLFMHICTYQKSIHFIQVFIKNL